MGKNAFEMRDQMRQQNLRERLADQTQEPVAATSRPGGVALPGPKPKRKQCSLYLDVEMMDRVKRVARQRGVTIGAVIEACVKMSLEKLEG